MKYIAYLLKDGKKTELGWFRSPAHFHQEYPRAAYIVAFRMIYTTDTMEKKKK